MKGIYSLPKKYIPFVLIKIKHWQNRSVLPVLLKISATALPENIP
jgi:hypothetical protein